MSFSRFSNLGPTLFCAVISAMLLFGGCAQDTITGPSPKDAEKEATVTQTSHNGDPAHSTDGGSTAKPGAGHNTTDED